MTYQLEMCGVCVCGNRILVRFRYLKTWTEPRSNPKFRFPWLFSKPNLSHTNNSQYLSLSNKALTFFTLRTLSDSKWSWNQIISRHRAITEHLENHRPKSTHKKDSLHVFFVFYVLKNRWFGSVFFLDHNKENWTAEQNLRFSQNRTELETSILHIPNISY